MTHAPVVWQDDNEFLTVTVHSDGAATITRKGDGATFHMGRVAIQEDNPIDVGHVWLRTERPMCEEYPGTFAITREGDGDTLCATLMGFGGRTMGQFRYNVRLDGDWFEVSIIEIDEALPSLIFPPPIVSDSLVLPRNVGKWIRKPFSYPLRQFWLYPGHLNMRWFGGLVGADNWIAILDQGYAHSGVLLAEMSASPGWLKSLGQWRDLPRTVRYQFGRGGYVELAKTYRAYAMERGLFRSLAEKIDATPALANLRGGRMLSFMMADSSTPGRYEERLQPVPAGLHGKQLRVGTTYADIARIIGEAKAAGMARGIVNLRGWIAGGYDESHPDVWPPEPALGTEGELRALLASPDPLLTVLHDNYQDIYEQSASYPQGIIQTQNGNGLIGGFWAGGQSYIINARNSVANARRNWPDLQTVQPRGMFIDTTIAVQLYESYEDGNTLTREQDMMHKAELLRFYKEQGQVLGSEEGQDWGMSLVDWIENRHHLIPGESIPLWPLVYHDAAFCYRYHAQARATDPAMPSYLADMLWGYNLFFDVRDRSHWPAMQDAFRAANDVEDWLYRIGLDEMLSHRYLSEDGKVEETTFTNGRIIVNTAPEARTVEGVTISGYGYHLDT
jgi:hypothetical protein